MPIQSSALEMKRAIDYILKWVDQCNSLTSNYLLLYEMGGTEGENKCCCRFVELKNLCIPDKFVAKGIHHTVWDEDIMYTVWDEDIMYTKYFRRPPKTNFASVFLKACVCHAIQACSLVWKAVTEVLLSLIYYERTIVMADRKSMFYKTSEWMYMQVGMQCKF